VVSFTPRPLYPQGKGPSYPLDRRLGGPQSRSGRGGEEKNSQLPPEIEPWNPDRPAPSPALYRLRYHSSSGYIYIYIYIYSVSKSSRTESITKYTLIYLWYCSLRSKTESYGGKTHETDSQTSDTTVPSGRKLYHLQFSLPVTSPETFGYTPAYTHTHTHTHTICYLQLEQRH
jgi:hypothetical protein